MTLDEAARLVTALEDDPSSKTHASAAGWTYPMSHEALILAAIFDRHGALARLRGKFTFPRPWEREEDERQVQRMGNAAGRTPQQVMEILARFGHKPPQEVA